jgi:hypothetical protein
VAYGGPGFAVSFNDLSKHIAYTGCFKKSFTVVFQIVATVWRRRGEKRNAYRWLVGKREGTLGRPRHRWLHNIRTDLVRWDGMMRTGLVWLSIGTGGELL